VLLAVCQGDILTLFCAIPKHLEDLVGEWICGIGFIE
jgi:hypothetical protein